jgi:hypothetical protein
MQYNFCSPLQFLQRTDALASVLACNLNDLPAKIGISERSLYGYRAGKYPVTAKALRKLAAAEKAAGMHMQRKENTQSSANLKDSDIGDSAHAVRENPAIYRMKTVAAGETPAPGAESLDERVERLERLVAAIQDALRIL